MTAEFAEKLKQVYFLQKVKIAAKQMERDKQRPNEYFEHHFCANNLSSHDFQLFSPHKGCTKMVCRFCVEESPEKLLRASVYSYKGRSFAPKKSKTKKPKTKKTTGKTESGQEWE